MNADMEEQEDELLALHSILGPEEFARDESKFSGEIRVSVELPGDFTVALKEGETLRQDEISFLPPLCLTFELLEDYPSSVPPSFTLTCSWLSHTQLSALTTQLTDLYQATGGAVVLFTWVQFLKEDALKFLDIQTVLELPSDEECGTQDLLNTAPSETKKIQHAENQTTDSQGAVASDSCKVQHINLTSSLSEVCQNGFKSLPNEETMVRITSDIGEAEQTSEFKADVVSSADFKSKHLPFTQSDESGQEELEGNLLVSLSLPSSTSSPLDQSGAASLPGRPRESPQNKNQPPPGRRSLTPSQALLSQLLIYDAAQRERMFATTVFDCGVCLMGWLGSDCVQLPDCGHIFCRSCLAEFCKLQITEGNVQGVTCPQADCTATPTPAQVRSLVGEELFARYDRLLLQKTLDCMSDVVYCPRPSCGSAVIQDSTVALCQVCGFAFCVICKKTYHGVAECPVQKFRNKLTAHSADSEQVDADLPQSQDGLKALWDDYASGSKRRQGLLESRYGREALRVTVVECLSEDWVEVNSKYCPHCFCRIEKNRGCNMMTCSQCRRLFCWACLARLSFIGASLHFQEGLCSQYDLEY